MTPPHGVSRDTTQHSTRGIPAYPRCVSPRRVTLALIAAVALAAGLLGAAPAMAKPVVVVPAWNPVDPPADVAVFAEELSQALYGISCGGVSATGWSADAADDTRMGWKTSFLTSSAVTLGCIATVARQRDDTVEAFYSRTDASARASVFGATEDLPYIDWDFVPTPQAGQWVGVGARSADGAVLPMVERRIVEVGTDIFTVDGPIDRAYLGAPVVDNMGRALGMVTEAGTVITGAPKFCASLFVCTDATKVWWDITAPSGVRKLTATPGKGSVTFSWMPVASDGGDDVGYWYRVGQGAWLNTEEFSVKVKARKGKRVTIFVWTVNRAGLGPQLSVSASAR